MCILHMYVSLYMSNNNVCVISRVIVFQFYISKKKYCHFTVIAFLYKDNQ